MLARRLTRSPSISMGAGGWFVGLRHILPELAPLIVPQFVRIAHAAIMVETSLSFLGFGVRTPDISLGQIISEYQGAFNTRPWLFWWPGLFIIIIALAINFVGDGLRDAFDPRQKGMPNLRPLRKQASDLVRGWVAGSRRERDTATLRQ